MRGYKKGGEKEKEKKKKGLEDKEWVEGNKSEENKNKKCGM